MSGMAGTAGLGAAGMGAGGLTLAGDAAAQARSSLPFSLSDLRGTANAAELGLTPGAIDDQSRLLQSILERAEVENKPVFLPPGDYFVSNIQLPARTRLMGVPGASRLIYTGSGHLLISENASHVELTGLVIDGANRGMHSYAGAAVRITNAAHAVIENCHVVGSIETGIRFERSRGRIEGNRISGAAGDCGIFALESAGLSITDNTVSDCINGGILVHRWEQGEDGTIVSGNRIERIGAANGGTGQWGNGINVYRAGNVMIANNHISDCAFSAIRSNSGNNVQISSNTCLRSGETALYSEFGFEGAMIANNVIDGGSRGISIANFMDGGRLAVVSGNLIRNIATPPPYDEDDHLWFEGISAEADTAISGNVIEDALNFGIMLGWGPYLRDVIASGNIIRNSRTGIYVSVADGAGTAQISGNTITGAREGAVVGYRWKERATGDLAVQGGETGYPHLTVERNRVS